MSKNQGIGTANYFDRIHWTDGQEIDAASIFGEPLVNENVGLLSKEPLRARFAAQDWHYGILIPVNGGHSGGVEPIVAQFTVQVANAEVRVGCVDTGLATYVSDEIPLYPDTAPQAVEVEVPDGAAFVVFRTGLTSGASAPPELQIDLVRAYRVTRTEPGMVVDVPPAARQEKPGALRGGNGRAFREFELLVTHSTRKFDHARASADFIRARYADRSRLENVPPFETLASSSTKHYMHGALTHFRLRFFGEEASLEALRCIDSRELIQHAVVVGGRLVVCCSGFLVVLPSIHYPLTGTEFDPGSPFRIDDPWFSGLHSVVPANDEECVVSASGPDAVLWVDLRKKIVTRRFRLPESLYGVNYRLTPEMSVHDHYIPNDYQLGHLNSAFPDDDGGCFVTTLGQGDIGHFDREGRYERLATGYVGAHGIRRSLDGSYLYFTESPAGKIRKLSFQGNVGTIAQVRTGWLHDAQQIAQDLFVCLPVDRNELLIIDVRNEREVVGFDLSQRGLNPQFLSIVRS